MKSKRNLLKMMSALAVAATLACATTGGERAVAHDGQSALTRCIGCVRCIG